jgi:cell division septal protein FtsQ
VAHAPRPARAAIARDRGRRRRTALLATLAGAAALAGGWWIVTGPPARIHGVSVTGYRGPDRALLEAWVRAIARDGTVTSPPTGEIRAALARFPWVERVDVSRVFPRAIRVDVTQAKAVAVAVPDRGPRMLLSPEGRVLGPAPSRAHLARIRVSGTAPPAGARLADPQSRVGLELAAALGPALSARLRAVRVRAGALAAHLAAGPDLRLGPPDDIERKARAIVAVLDRLTPEERRSAAYIDVSVPDQPAAGPPRSGTVSPPGTSTSTSG